MEQTSRYWRLSARNGQLIGGPIWKAGVKGRFCQALAGTYRHIEVKPDGTIVISPKAYADDVVAFVSASIASNPTIADSIKAHLTAFLDDMDARAVARHGYADDPNEAAVVWKATK